MTQAKFTEGQAVWIKGGGKYDTELVKRTVSSVGRKYVTVGRRKYDVHTRREVKDVGEEGYLYLSKQEYEDELELEENKSQITSCFSRYSKKEITLEQTREILLILKGAEEK